MQKEEYLIKNACYSPAKYYLCKQNNKRSLLGRKQRSQVVRSFPNRYQFSYTNKVTYLFSIRYILMIILRCQIEIIIFLQNYLYKTEAVFPRVGSKLLVFLGRLETLYKPFLIQCQESNKPRPNFPQYRPQAAKKENHLPSYFYQTITFNRPFFSVFHQINSVKDLLYLLKFVILQLG